MDDVEIDGTSADVRMMVHANIPFLGEILAFDLIRSTNALAPAFTEHP
jgi:hypothetical protein